MRTSHSGPRMWRERFIIFDLIGRTCRTAEAAESLRVVNPLYATALFQTAPPPCGWPRAFAIITACNPRGQTEDTAQNVEHDARLAERLQTLRCWRWRVIGGSPDFHHAEPGFAVELPLPDALAVGCEFEQEAIFWIEDDELSVIAAEGEARQKLGSWRERLARGNAVRRKAPCFGAAPDKNAQNS